MKKPSPSIDRVDKQVVLRKINEIGSEQTLKMLRSLADIDEHCAYWAAVVERYIARQQKLERFKRW